MAGTVKVTEMKGGAHVEFVDAEVTGISWKKGRATLTLVCETKGVKGTRRELDKVTSEGFKAQVVIEGEIVQTEMDFGDEGEGGETSGAAAAE